MGWLRKKVKQVGRAIKKVGKKIGKAFKSILKPFSKVFGKLGPLGSLAMMFILPGVGQMMAGWGAGMSSPIGSIIKHVGNAINFVATGPQKIFKTITGGISNAWNSLLGRDPTGLNVNQMLETMDPSQVADVVKAEGASTSWWDRFTKDVRKTWTSDGVVAKIDDPGGLFKKGDLIGEGNFWDVSKQGQVRTTNFGTDLSTMGEDIKNVFKKDPRKPMTLDQAKDSLGGVNSNAYKEFVKNSGNKTHILDRTGVFGNIRDAVGGTGSKIGNITVPVLGEVKDVANVGSMAIGTYSTLAQHGVVGSDDDFSGGSGMGFAAQDQLGSIHDQGSQMQSFTFDPTLTLAQNRNRYVPFYNQQMGFPPNFDPYFSPFYGESFNTSFERTITA